VGDTVTMTLTEFLLARIAEDEAAATSASHHSHLVHDYERDNHGFLWVRTTRVLAECEAKRRIVEEHRPGGHLGDAPDECSTCAEGATEHYGDPVWYGQDWPCTTLSLLALPYSDHPDYRSEWKP
jgi:hypothetical protein